MLGDGKWRLLKALGGSLEVSEAASKQGGFHIERGRWDNGEEVRDSSEIIDLNNLLLWCERNDVDSVGCLLAGIMIAKGIKEL